MLPADSHSCYPKQLLSNFQENLKNLQRFDLDNPDHEEKMGYGRAILFFTCKVRATTRSPAGKKHLVFMEEADYLADEYKCHRFYSKRPNPAYSVVDIDHILGPAALFRYTVNPCIPPRRNL
jgi:hypothetical protein